MCKKVFPAAFRVNATGALAQWRQQLQARMSRNLVVDEPGGGVEVFGASEAVNNMLLWSHEGFLRLFPAW